MKRIDENDLYRLEAMVDDDGGTWRDLSIGDKKAIDSATKCIKAQESLLDRAMAIITNAIMHGMPVTKEVADVRNAIVGAPEVEVTHDQ